MSYWFYQPAVQLLGHWSYVFQHICDIAPVDIWNLFCLNHVPVYATSLGSIVVYP